MNKNEILISLITLGCNKNQTDSEFLLKGLSLYFTITSNLDETDVIILNTCAFLKEARLEAKQYISNLVKYKNKNLKCLVITGCYAEFLKNNNENLENIFEKVDLILGLLDVKTFSSAIKNFLKNKKKSSIFHKEKNIFGLFDEDKINRLVSHPNYAYLKISEGCNNKCSYCLIPSIRGNFKSRRKEIILNESNILIDKNIKEINIISQDIGQYGLDLYKNYNLINLLEDLDKTKKEFWIRLLYLHPKYINKKLIELIKNHNNILNYIDIPLQHINNKILKNMNRHITTTEILEKLNLLKENIPDICIRTTFIVGFPGETENDFREILSLVEQKYFDRLGVFTYSREKGTLAYDMNNQIPENIKNIRKDEIMKLEQKILLEKNKEYLGKIFKFLPEKIENDFIIGRIYSMAPEVDGNIYINIKNNKKITKKNFNDFWDIKLTESQTYDFIAEKLN